MYNIICQFVFSLYVFLRMFRIFLSPKVFLPCLLLYFFQMSWFRALSFGLKGYCDFTRPAFLKAKKSFKPLQDDLSGKIVIITGGNSGIGYEAAIILAKVGEVFHQLILIISSDGSGSSHSLQIT